MAEHTTAAEHACMHACMHMHAHACMHAYAYAYACMHACMRACVRACMHACMHAIVCSAVSVLGQLSVFGRRTHNSLVEHTTSVAKHTTKLPNTRFLAERGHRTGSIRPRHGPGPGPMSLVLWTVSYVICPVLCHVSFVLCPMSRVLCPMSYAPCWTTHGPGKFPPWSEF